MTATPPEPPPADPVYRYGSAEQDAYHDYMDGAGTPDPGGRRNRAIDSFFKALAVLAGLLVLAMIIGAIIRDSGDARPATSEARP